MNPKLPEGASCSNHEDSNANVNNEINVSKGAIPKTKNYLKNSQNGKKSAKLNNNIENITSPTNDSSGSNLCRNGFTKSLGNAYFNKSLSVEKRMNDWEGTESRVIQDVYLNNESDSSSSDDNDLSVSDDGCIYTFKADSVPDLPDLFNNLDIPILDNEPNERREGTSSPEMDFLEMDFDPEPSGDTETEPISTVQGNELNETHSDENSVLDYEEPSGSKTSNDSTENPEPTEKRQNSEVLHNTEKKSVVKPHMKKVKNEIKMPWSCTLHQRTKATKQLRIMRADLSTPEELSAPMKIFDAVLEQEERDERRIMIWSNQEAYVKQITQIGPSSCGATAILNVLIALRLPVPSLDLICDCVKSKTRFEPDLLPYLLSRSREGRGHREIISGLHKASNGRIYARFFSMYPERCVNIYDWLGFWVEHGAIPVATLNIQKSEEPIPDGWYHQMIYGVDPNNIYLTNPLECVNSSVLWHQLVSESVLLVRREDIMCRFNGRTALEKLQLFKDTSYDEMNVLGQVAKVIRENSRIQRENSHITSHIKIPTDCRSGITLAIDKNSKAYPLLLECPELPLLNLNKQ